MFKYIHRVILERFAFRFPLIEYFYWDYIYLITRFFIKTSKIRSQLAVFFLDL